MYASVGFPAEAYFFCLKNWGNVHRCIPPIFVIHIARPCRDVACYVSARSRHDIPLDVACYVSTSLPLYIPLLIFVRVLFGVIRSKLVLYIGWHCRVFRVFNGKLGFALGE